MSKEKPEQNYGECSGYCTGCEKFTEEQKVPPQGRDARISDQIEDLEKFGKSEKERSKESIQEEKLDKLVRELKKTKEKKAKEYKKKKYN